MNRIRHELRTFKHHQAWRDASLIPPILGEWLLIIRKVNG
jgi:hypothetical protein